MVVHLADWSFSVDVEANMQTSSAQAADHCTCGYCRNFYQTVDTVYPQLRPFLGKFGVDVEGPDELSPFEPTIYEVSYIVQGEILREGKSHLRIHDVPIAVRTASQADMDTQRKAPYFVLVIGLLELPWSLDEAMDAVVSPANEESYMQRMWQKLMNRAEQDDVIS